MSTNTILVGFTPTGLVLNISYSDQEMSVKSSEIVLQKIWYWSKCRRFQKSNQNSKSKKDMQYNAQKKKDKQWSTKHYTQTKVWSTRISHELLNK